MKRPSRYDEPIRRAAANFMAERICTGWDHDGKPEDWVEDLLKCVDYDGCGFARRLADRCYVDPDSELVEMLDNWSWDLSRAENDAVRKWVAAMNPQTQFSVGSHVLATLNNVTKPATVTAIKSAEAIYIVHFDDSDKPLQDGCGTYINFEDCAPFPSPAPSPPTQGDVR